MDESLKFWKWKPDNQLWGFLILCTFLLPFVSWVANLTVLDTVPDITFLRFIILAAKKFWLPYAWVIMVAVYGSLWLTFPRRRW